MEGHSFILGRRTAYLVGTKIVRMHFTQLNMHKAKLAAVELHDKLQRKHDIALLTEPYLFRNKIVGLPRGYQAFISKAGDLDGKMIQARAAILAPRDLNMVQIDTLCGLDYVTCQFITKQGLFIVASVYMDIKKEVDQALLDRIAAYTEEKRAKLILAVDTNAHSQLYGNCLLYTSDAADE